MKTWRAHRFVPLSELLGSAAGRPGLPAHLSAHMQAQIEEGFQQGIERGYREGLESGKREGFERGLAEGREAGRSAGAQEGRQAALERFESLARPVDALKDALERLHHDYQQALRKEVVDLVARVARQVIRCEIALQPQQLLALVDETLATMPRIADNQIEVYLSEADLERILELDVARTTRWNLIADPTLEPGEVRVKAGLREADAGCRQRLAACMKQIATQVLPHEQMTESAS